MYNIFISDRFRAELSCNPVEFQQLVEFKKQSLLINKIIDWEETDYLTLPLLVLHEDLTTAEFLAKTNPLSTITVISFIKPPLIFGGKKKFLNNLLEKGFKWVQWNKQTIVTVSLLKSVIDYYENTIYPTYR